MGENTGSKVRTHCTFNQDSGPLVYSITYKQSLKTS